MKFKTKIVITTEAENKSEAMEIVGEYLSGYLSSGVDMNCTTKRIHKYNNAVITVVAVSLVLALSVLFTGSIKPTKGFTGLPAGISAIQPPLKTSPESAKGDFKKDWEKEQTKKAIDHIKN